MRSRIRPAFLPAGGGANTVLAQATFAEDDIQWLVHQHPEILPLGEIDPAFEGAVSICREFSTPAGRIDNLLLTPTGLPIIVECKLWRNPQARREVVGQVLEYARELSRFTSADLEREAAKRGIGSIFEHIRKHHPEVDEIGFHDTLTRSLSQGRFLLLIVGDGISANVEAIFEQLAAQGALHFSFGLIEMPIFRLPDGNRLAVPRVLARVGVEVRKVVEMPPGFAVVDPEGEDDDEIDDSSRETRRAGHLARKEARTRFWEKFLARLELDDPEQPIPQSSTRGSLMFSLPVPGSSSWLTTWRSPRDGEVGVFLSFRAGSLGERIARNLAETGGAEILLELGDTANIGEKDGIPVFRDRKVFGDLSRSDIENAAIEWLAGRVNRFVNVLRPAVRSAAFDLGDE